jgi:regulator of protease activity HflC (stomatin/prohibitin superfamily)
MERAMARQAQAERERRAKVIHADGEYQAATKLKEAAGTISAQPMALQLRFLQTLTEISSDSKSTLVFPVPLDVVRPFLNKQ